MTSELPLDAPRILLVEDDPVGGRQLLRFLLSFGYEVVLVAGQAAAVEQIAAHGFQGAIVDLTLSDGDGFGVLEDLHRHAPSIPVICISGQGDLSARVQGLKAGFDHYLGKPLEPLELEALLSAALRRQAQEKTPDRRRSSNERWTICTAERCLRLDGKRIIPITDTEQLFLRQLRAAAPATLDRASIIAGLGQSERYYLRARLDTMVSRLRHKIADVTDVPPPFISIYGIGYAWVETTADETS
ncbi:response regulator transcription factor [Thiocapsa rosea]|uniref:DNA-binding response OmpR family regulator n=1 Tax=Thiocapsa rosea TaxID=69360 RepID=A0A495VGP6_9GAMM|nr:response regulator transcription factor [Thiocapsa rosea]RKT47615.1 DNA-binding response OmpR family regulator [Thiocapsa rosea]